MNTAEKLRRTYWTVFIAPAFHKVICNYCPLKAEAMKLNTLQCFPQFCVAKLAQKKDLCIPHSKYFSVFLFLVCQKTQCLTTHVICPVSDKSSNNACRDPGKTTETQAHAISQLIGQVNLSGAIQNYKAVTNGAKKQKHEKLDHNLMWQVAWLSWWKYCEFLQRRHQTRYYCICEVSLPFSQSKNQEKYLNNIGFSYITQSNTEAQIREMFNLPKRS